MTRAVVSWWIFLGASLAQTPAEVGQPKFDVASIRLSSLEELGGPSGMQTSRGLVRAVKVTLKRCISGSYEVAEDRVLGGPEWAEYDRFDITAKADQPFDNDVLNVMLQTLLADRFKLVLHRESRRGEAMVLEVAKNGPTLQPAGDGPSSWKDMHDHLEATKITIGEFAKILSRDLKLPVLDRTGLAGTYNFTLRWNAANADGLDHDEAISALRLEMSSEAHPDRLCLRQGAVRIVLALTGVAEIATAPAGEVFLPGARYSFRTRRRQAPDTSPGQTNHQRRPP